MQYNNGNLHPVLANYAKDIFIGLIFLIKNYFKQWPRFLFSFCLLDLFD